MLKFFWIIIVATSVLISTPIVFYLNYGDLINIRSEVISYEKIYEVTYVASPDSYVFPMYNLEDWIK